MIQKFYMCVESGECCLLVDEYSDKILFTVQDISLEDEAIMFLGKEDVRSLISRLELWLNER